MPEVDLDPDKLNHEAAFESALRDLIDAASAHGVDVTGGWRIPRDNYLDYGIEIVPVTHNSD